MARVWGRAVRRTQQFGLFTASGLVLLVGLTVTAGVWIGLAFLLNHHWPWYRPPGQTPTSNLDLTKVALAVVAGVGAAIGLTVTYRRQRDLERGRFDERFAAAAAQLGADSAAQRLAGVYAVGALADEHSERRQQCIDLLCAYIRLPYDPAAGLLRTVVSEHTWPVGTATGKEQRTYERLPNDRDVRLAIISLITSHLRADAKTSWSEYDYDFSGALFDGGDFVESVFSGGEVSFAGSVFSGGEVRFDRADFSGSKVSFAGSVFSGSEVSFDGSVFSGSEVRFDDAEFSEGVISFDVAEFYRGVISFDEAVFSGGLVRFNQAVFSGDVLVRFDEAVFSGGEVHFLGGLVSSRGLVRFAGAVFSGGGVRFDRTEFSGGAVGLGGAVFSGGLVSFAEAVFSGGVVRLHESKVSGGGVRFDRAEFSGSEVRFDGSVFSGGEVRFDRAVFSGGEVSFGGAVFSGGIVTRDGQDFRGYPEDT